MNWECIPLKTTTLYCIFPVCFDHSTYSNRNSYMSCFFCCTCPSILLYYIPNRRICVDLVWILFTIVYMSREHVINFRIAYLTF
ncbi:hypothetical protein BC833DRAFT_596221, partial [Globomyces pollinis-pini]